MLIFEVIGLPELFVHNKPILNEVWRALLWVEVNNEL